MKDTKTNNGHASYVSKTPRNQSGL